VECERQANEEDTAQQRGHPHGRRDREFPKHDPPADVTDRLEDGARERRLGGPTRRGPTERRRQRAVDAGIDVRDVDGAGRDEDPKPRITDTPSSAGGVRSAGRTPERVC
jgi:hypothetical protein